MLLPLDIRYLFVIYDLNKWYLQVISKIEHLLLTEKLTTLIPQEY
jgi:hypothetical protein